MPSDVVIPVVVALLIGAGVVFAVAVWHFSRALVARMRRWGEQPALDRGGHVAVLEGQAAILAEFDTLRRELGELTERVDFAERVLAKQRDVERIGPGR